MWDAGQVWDLQRYRVEPFEWLRVFSGRVLVCSAAVMTIDGVLSLDGLVRVG